MTYSLWRRVAVQAGILLLMLAALECALRSAGYFHRLSRTIASGKDAAATVLCLGDSYTYGGDTPRAYTYPAQLQQVLDKRSPGSFRVVNGGICEETSLEMLDRLDGLLDKNTPDIAVLFIGSANLFKLHFRDGRPSWLLRAATDMRIYRMVHIISVNLRARFANRSAGLEETYRETPPRYNHSAPALRIKHKKDPASLTAVEKIWHAMDENDYSAAEAMALDGMRKKPDDPELLYALGNIKFRQGHKTEAVGIVRKLLKIADAALAKDPADLYARGLKAFCFYGLADMAISSYRFSDAIPYLLEGLQLDPGAPRMHYLLSQSYSLQSVYTAEYIAERLEALTKTDERLAADPVFTSHLLYFRETSEVEGRVRRLLEADLSEAVRRLKKRGVRIIFQNYPVSFPLANNALKETARVHGLEFLDIEKMFAAIVKRGERDRYLMDMDHFTPEGNRLLAETMADAILKTPVTGSR